MDLKDLLTKLREGEETILTVAGKEGDRKIAVELRKLHPEAPRPPIRAESPPRCHTFASAGALAAYLARYGSAKTVVYADAAGEAVHAVLDETAEDGFEIVTFRPAMHPFWKPWHDLAGKRVKLLDFANFAAQNRRTIEKPAGLALAQLFSQVRASVKVERQTGRGKNAVNGVVVTTVIQGAESKDLLEIPDVIVLRVPLYIETDPVAVELDLCVEADRDGEVFVVVSAGTVAQARFDAFTRMLEVISAGAEQLGAVMTHGKPGHAGWSYLPELKAQ